MLKRRKPQKIVRRGKKARRRFKILGPIRLGFKLAAVVAIVAAVTGFFILAHDVFTQCDYFRIDKLTIQGSRKLTKDQIARQAKVRTGVNVMAVNIALVRKRLLAHPWIDEAEVSREIPNGLHIRIKEQSPLAIVDVGHKFLINQRGKVFKVWDVSDPSNLPVISGLNASDLTAYAQPEPPKGSNKPGPPTPFKAVMQVLRLGAQQGSILPNRTIRRIRVDRQIGLTIFAFDRIKTINLGYKDYAGKYHMLANLFSYLKRQRSISDIDRIDLNNLNRVVVNPVKFVSRSPGS
ncbi:MAG: FtsQ-type POTRA domain-containing protein [Desulfobacterales bacterium]|nr:FtsQ-type POTRA domain-containing protein [Desulfobacterales bacterium]